MSRKRDKGRKLSREFPAPEFPRRLRKQENFSPTRALIDGREAVLFAGNDYLGLSWHPAVIDAAGRALAEYGASAGASRLVTGNHPLYRELESALAALKGKEAALVFPSGYMANLGLLSALAGPGGTMDMGRTIYMDRLNHASLYDGCRLSGVDLKRYRHGDTGHLDAILSRGRKRRVPGGAGAAKSLIVTDGVFSMDGDLAPLDELERLADEYSAMLVVDDAHGTGVIGPEGRGTAAQLGVEPDVEVGTMSKAIGSLGGFVAGSRELIDYLVNRARPFIFTTGLPPAAVAAATAAVGLFKEEAWRRERVLDLAARARTELAASGFETPAGFTPIIPVIAGDESLAVKLSELCLERGVFIPAIRTPAVPRGRARLRMTVSAAHSDEELARAIDAVTESAGELALI